MPWPSHRMGARSRSAHHQGPLTGHWCASFVMAYRAIKASLFIGKSIKTMFRQETIPPRPGSFSCPLSGRTGCFPAICRAFYGLRPGARGPTPDVTLALPGSPERRSDTPARHTPKPPKGHIRGDSGAERHSAPHGRSARPRGAAMSVPGVRARSRIRSGKQVHYDRNRPQKSHL